MSEAKVGALVRYCGHEAVFVADIWRIGNVNVVKANGPLVKNSMDTKWLVRDPSAYESATHQLVDFPQSGYWKPQDGLFVVPEAQVRKL